MMIGDDDDCDDDDFDDDCDDDEISAITHAPLRGVAPQTGGSPSTSNAVSLL